jgi:predicted RNA binding protein YcfA (HicA-like mRNA interferase family)
MTLSSREVIKALQAAGFVVIDQKGSHVQFKHPARAGRVTVPHPKRDLRIKTIKSIERQSGLRFRKVK